MKEKEEELKKFLPCPFLLFVFTASLQSGSRALDGKKKTKEGRRRYLARREGRRGDAERWEERKREKANKNIKYFPDILYLSFSSLSPRQKKKDSEGGKTEEKKSSNNKGSIIFSLNCLEPFLLP